MRQEDERFISRSFELAKMAVGVTFPNPLVGALVVLDGEIVGEGYHRGVGSPHAEAEAIRRAGDRTKNATLYLNLEPCCHFGRTPPCTEAIVESGIERVVFSILDPDKRVKGKGARYLEARGVEVDTGVLAREALELNLPYIHRSITGEPFVVLKLASTLDGRLTAGARRYLTGEEALRRVHYLRAWAEAIAVGIGTLEADDPILDRRFYREGLPPPTRMVFDSNLRFPPTHRWLSEDGRVIVYCRRGTQQEKITRLELAGAEVTQLPQAEMGVDLSAWREDVKERGITSVIVEGGGGISTSILIGNIHHRLVIFYAPLVSGKNGVDWFQGAEEPEWTEGGRYFPVSTEMIGRDLMVVYDSESVIGYLEQVSLE
ncbi:MAG: bifunctional diaminohydroxyphosphoribosylaminopyrimidine deaminase/5-amino-6-(5-phosphoribosylamino)uracil reductase RibD [Candidatus Krumholzibacteria bacterium]|nr:bifunctional diaminohydroxyphosphoribosylaminopyrimidine deaminase/5-amino-6-(5-phosphoribosylamino)uracil reductase RibD [Candidatus Krumholzibacteria bacterium]